MPRRERLGAGVVLAVSLVACAAPPRSRAGPPLSAPAVRARLARAEGLASRGDVAGALRVLRATALRVPPPLRGEVARRRRALKARWVRRALAPRCTLRPRAVVVGEPLALELVLTNRGSGPVRIPAADRRGWFLWARTRGESLLNLTYRVRAVDPLGSVLREERTELLPLGEDVVLPPGETWRRTVTLSTARWEAPTTLLRELVVAVRLRPVGVWVGEERWLLPLPFPAARAWLLPHGAEAIRRAPLRHLALALRRALGEPRFLVHIPVAAVLLSAPQRERGRALLAPAARRRDALGRVAARALALIPAGGKENGS